MTSRSFAVKISPQLGDRLVTQAQSLGITEAELIQRAIAAYLEPHAHGSPPTDWQQQLAQIEQRLQALEERQHLPTSPEPPGERPPAPPTIRQLRVGDIVQIRDQDSVHYLSHVPLVKVSLIRATVRTDEGEQSFLKRDLRFIRSGQEPDIAP